MIFKDFTYIVSLLAVDVSANIRADVSVSVDGCPLSGDVSRVSTRGWISPEECVSAAVTVDTVLLPLKCPPDTRTCCNPHFGSIHTPLLQWCTTGEAATMRVCPPLWGGRVSWVRVSRQLKNGQCITLPHATAREGQLCQHENLQRRTFHFGSLHVQLVNSLFQNHQFKTKSLKFDHSETSISDWYKNCTYIYFR